MVTLQCQAMAEDAFGPIFLDLEGAAFPEDGWEDFAGLMLFEWLASTVRWMQDEAGAQDAAGAPCIYRFMDGPYEFHATRVSPLDPNGVVLTFHERLAGESSRVIELAPVTVERGAFLRILLDAASKIHWERGRAEVDDMMRILSQSAAERSV